MAKILYKKGMEGQNKLSCIQGIEINLLNGQKALIYPKYAERQMLTSEQISKWSAENEMEIEALRRTSTALETEYLREIDSPAALWVSNIKRGRYGNFALPSLLAAMEIQHQKEDIDALAETIEGADLLKNCTDGIWSCSRYVSYYGWFAGSYGYAVSDSLYFPHLVVPTILYR